MKLSNIRYTATDGLSNPLSVKADNGMREEIKSEIRSLLNSLGMTGYIADDGKVIDVLNVHTIVNHYLTYTYTKSDNYTIAIETTGVRKKKIFPVAINRYYSSKTKASHGSYLQWCHWAQIDNEINRILDRLGISATLTSDFGTLRDGTVWTVINTKNPIHESQEIHQFHSVNKPIEVA